MSEVCPKCGRSFKRLIIHSRKCKVIPKNDDDMDVDVPISIKKMSVDEEISFHINAVQMYYKEAVSLLKEKKNYIIKQLSSDPKSNILKLLIWLNNEMKKKDIVKQIAQEIETSEYWSFHDEKHVNILMSHNTELQKNLIDLFNDYIDYRLVLKLKCLVSKWDMSCLEVSDLN